MPKNPRRRARHLNVAVGTASVAVALGGWQLTSAVNPLYGRFLSAPSSVLAAARRLMLRGDLWLDIRTTLTVYLIGLAAAIVLGLVVGITLGWYRRVYATVNPLLQLYNVLPSVVLVPILLLAMGLGPATKVVITILAASKAVIFNMIAGVENIDAEVLRASRSFGATDRQIFRLIVLPSTVPYLLAALRQAGGLALLGVVVGEFFVAGAGVGSLILRSSFSMRTDEMFVGIFVLIGLALCIDYALGFVQAHIRTR